MPFLGNLSRFLLLVTLLIACREGPVVSQSIEVPENLISGKFTPPPGQTLLIVGQDLGAVATLKAHIGPIPGGVTTYTNISEGNQSILLYGLTETVNWGSGDVNAQRLVEDNPHSALVIGLYLVDETGTNLAHIADGTHDDAVRRLGQFILDADRPVFVRIGYEFDGPWNHYEPAAYIAAYRHIVDLWREMQIDNVATVWQSATAPVSRYRNFKLEAWYPGDDYVDWIGSSYFEFSQPIHDELLAFARQRQKPVMIAESTPQGYDLEALTYAPPAVSGATFKELSAAEIWSLWYQPYFDYIYKNADVIRAVAYINVDWKNQPMWGPNGNQGYWGDSRLHINDEIMANWLTETEKPLWLHGSVDLFVYLQEETQ